MTGTVVFTKEEFMIPAETDTLCLKNLGIDLSNYCKIIKNFHQSLTIYHRNGLNAISRFRIELFIKIPRMNNGFTNGE